MRKYQFSLSTVSHLSLSLSIAETLSHTKPLSFLSSSLSLAIVANSPTHLQIPLISHFSLSLVSHLSLSLSLSLFIAETLSHQASLFSLIPSRYFLWFLAVEIDKLCGFLAVVGLWLMWMWVRWSSNSVGRWWVSGFAFEFEFGFWFWFVSEINEWLAMDFDFGFWFGLEIGEWFSLDFGFWFWLDFAMDFAKRRWVVWLRSLMVVMVMVVVVVVVVGGWQSKRNRDQREKWEIFLYYFNV